MSELTVSVAQAIAEGQGATAWEVYQLARSFLHAHGIEAPAFTTHPQPVTPAGGEVQTGLIEALRHQEQCDEDGVMCIVSREAIDAAINLLTQAHPPVADAALVRDAERYRWLRDDASRGQVDVFLDRRGTRLAADRVCDHGIELVDAALNQRGG